MQVGRHRRLPAFSPRSKCASLRPTSLEAIPTPKVTHRQGAFGCALAEGEHQSDHGNRNQRKPGGNRSREGRLQRLYSLRPGRRRGLGKHFVGQHTESVYSCSEQVGETCFGEAKLRLRKERGRQVAKPQCIKVSIFQEMRWVQDCFAQ